MAKKRRLRFRVSLVDLDEPMVSLRELAHKAGVEYTSPEVQRCVSCMEWSAVHESCSPGKGDMPLGTPGPYPVSCLAPGETRCLMSYHG
jgi:hypothetical protein